MSNTPSKFGRGARIVIAILVLYWLAMFAGTHSPRAPETAMQVNDKFLHFSGYCGLAFLLVCWWRAARRTATQRPIRILFTVVAIAAVYGALDEITQIPVGRDCSFYDWLADVSGAFTGALLATLAFAAWAWMRPAGPPSTEAPQPQ